MAYAIDTAAAISDIEEAGADPAVARAIVRTVASAGGELATKSDLAMLKSDLALAKSELKNDIATVKADVDTLKADVARLPSLLTVRMFVTQASVLAAAAMLVFAAPRFFGTA